MGVFLSLVPTYSSSKVVYFIAFHELHFFLDCVIVSVFVCRLAIEEATRPSG